MDDSIKIGDFVWFNGKKVVVDKINDSKIWLRDNGRRMDPVVLVKALESGSLSRTKPELELVEPVYKQQIISFDVANEPAHPYRVSIPKDSEPIESVKAHPEPEPDTHNEPGKVEEPKGGWSTDPRDPHCNPRVRVGEKYRTNDYGICTVSELRPGRVYMKTSKGKVVIFMYPHAFVNKKVTKV